MQKLWPQFRDDCVQFVSTGYDLVANNEVTKTLQINFGNVVEICHQNPTKGFVQRTHSDEVPVRYGTEAKAPPTGSGVFTSVEVG